MKEPRNVRTIKNIVAIIPIYCPGQEFAQVLDAVLRQTRRISKLILIDSSPSEITPINLQDPELSLSDIVIDYARILPRDFDHGGTRNFGVARAKGADAVLFLTQDVVMTADCIEQLAKFIDENGLSAAFARQLPRQGAGVLEISEREKSYSAESRINKGKPSSIMNVYFSNACSMVRRADFLAVGGFPEKIIMAEDMILAAKFLENHFNTGYCAKAQVYHSHAFKFFDLFKRYFDTGVMHTDWASMVPVHTSGKKGVGMVSYQFHYLLKKQPWSLGTLLLNVTAKYFGYQLGRHYKILPMGLRKSLSKNPGYWIEDGLNEI